MGLSWMTYRIPAWYSLKDRGWENTLGSTPNRIKETSLMTLRMLLIFPVFIYLGLLFGNLGLALGLAILTSTLMSVFGGLPYWTWHSGDPGKLSEYIAGFTFHTGIATTLILLT